MIERGHLEAMRVATRLASEHIQRGDIEAAAIATKQFEAVRRINLASKEILGELGIEDIPVSDSSDTTQSRQNFLRLVPDDFIANGTYSEQLKQYRKATGLSDAEFSSVLDVSFSTIFRHEKNQTKPNLKALLNTINRLGLNKEQAESFVKSAGFQPSVLDITPKS